jgi:hypothetical protein
VEIGRKIVPKEDPGAADLRARCDAGFRATPEFFRLAAEKASCILKPQGDHNRVWPWRCCRGLVPRNGCA